MKLTTKLLRQLIREAMNESSWDDEGRAFSQAQSGYKQQFKRSEIGHELRGEPTGASRDPGIMGDRRVTTALGAVDALKNQLAKKGLDAPDSVITGWVGRSGNEKHIKTADQFRQTSFDFAPDNLMIDENGILTLKNPMGFLEDLEANVGPNQNWVFDRSDPAAIKLMAILGSREIAGHDERIPGIVYKNVGTYFYVR